MSFEGSSLIQVSDLEHSRRVVSSGDTCVDIFNLKSCLFHFWRRRCKHDATCDGVVTHFVAAELSPLVNHRSYFLRQQTAVEYNHFWVHRQQQ